jgi:hypothetical protein
LPLRPAQARHDDLRTGLVDAGLKTLARWLAD